MAQIPHGPENLWCPMWRKPMCKVCHTCPMWTQMRGSNPNTGEAVDKWDCALAFGPMLAVENAQQSRQTGAAVESMRNEMVKEQQATRAEAQRSARIVAKTIEIAVNALRQDVQETRRLVGEPVTLLEHGGSDADR